MCDSCPAEEYDDMAMRLFFEVCVALLKTFPQLLIDANAGPHFRCINVFYTSSSARVKLLWMVFMSGQSFELGILPPSFITMPTRTFAVQPFDWIKKQLSSEQTEAK